MPGDFTNLEGYWKFNEDPGNLLDSSGNGRDLTETGTDVTFPSGLLDQCADFPNSESHYLGRSTNDTVFNFTGDFTIQFWVRFTSRSNEQSIIEKFTGGAGPGWTIYKTSGNAIAIYSDVWGEIKTADNKIAAADTWYHLVIRRSASDSNNIRIFLNATSEAATVDADNPSTTKPLVFGIRDGGQNNPLNGRLDEVAIWSRALADAEVTSLYNSGSGRDLGLTATANSTATITAAPSITIRALASNTKGTATITADLVYRNLKSTVSGTATIVNAVTVRSGPQVTVSAQANISSAVLRSTLAFVASPSATATIDELIRLYMKLTTTVSAQSRITAYANLFRPAVNPVYSGDLVSTSNYRLTVNGSVVDLTTTSKYNLVDMRFSYDGKFVSFTEIATPSVGIHTWPLDKVVQFEINFGSGFQTYFKGKIRSIAHQGSNNEEGLTYEAAGYQVVSDEYTVLSSDGRPDVTFTVGSTITSGTTISTAFTKKISEAISDLFELSKSGLNSLGVPATIGSPGLGIFLGYLPETVQLRNMGFNAALTQLAAYEPGVRPYFDDATQKWVFVNLLNQLTLDVDVRSVNLVNLDFDQDLSDRYTAVKLYRDPLATYTNTIDLDGRRGYVGRNTVTLTDFWDTTLVQSWSIYVGGGGRDPGVPEDNYHWVFRRFQIPDNIVDREHGTPVRVRQRIDVKQVDPASGIVSTIDTRYVPVRASVNFKRRLVVTLHPLVGAGNPYDPGKSVGPTEVQLTYWPLGAFKYTYVSSTSSDGTIATTAQTLTTEQYLSYIRYPEVGYQGTAFDFYNVQRELVRIVDPTQVTTSNAEALLKLHKDVTFKGDIPIDGDPLETAINLQCKVRVKHPSLATGLQSVTAMMTGYRYQFGKRGRNFLTLSTDVSGLVRTG